MKQLVIAVAGIGFAVAFSPSASAATNILVNPGFETGSLSPWFQSNDFGGPVDWTVSTTDPHSGTYDAMDDGNKELVQNFAGVPGSRISDISFWERHPNLSNAPSYVEVLFSDGSSNFEIVRTSDTSWDFFDVTSLVDPTKTWLESEFTDIAVPRAQEETLLFSTT